MNETNKRAYGLWDSPLSPKAMAGARGLKGVQWADGGALVWLESRDGTSVLVARDRDDASRDITQEHKVSGGVGYGGGEFCVHGERAYFACSDGRLYRVEVGEGTPAALTPSFGRLASPAASPDGEWVAYVHTEDGTDTIGVVDADGDRWPSKVASGADFYMHPSWSPDSGKLAWVEWDHPNMPWSGTRLKVADVDVSAAGVALADERQLAGGEDISVMQPEFSPDGSKLAYLSDEDGWWQLYLHDVETGESQQLTEGEFEIGGPAWVQGIRAYAWKADASGIYAIMNERGQMSLLDVNVDGGVESIDALSAYSEFAQPSVDDSGRLALLASSSEIPRRVISWAPGDSVRVEARSSAERLATEQLSEMQPVSWTAQSDGREVEIFGNFYAPTNPDFESDGKPPALVMVHGGPTSQRTARFESGNQFFASRGFAVLDVNYRGSTGYGREYRDALLGQWGRYDVEDAVSAAKFLAEEGHADPDRIVIMGGSAGGYTVLQTLCTHPGVFAAGISKYGISNLFSLSMDTHKFEQHYNDLLVGELPAAAETFRERSPLFHADNIEDPVALFQGGKDKVVPKNQADQLVGALERSGTPYEYEVYEEEGHGWRRSETIESFYESVMEFLKTYVIFGA
ncbi:MAG: LpqB family beta-propeller domain-containing protein [Myxococcota bacterium]